MKIKLDENFAQSLCGELGERGFDADSVYDERLAGKPDAVIFAAAQRERRLLFTHDLDFADARQFLPGTHAGIVLFRLGPASRQTISDRVMRLCETHDILEFSQCHVVVTPNRVRVSRPR